MFHSFAVVLCTYEVWPVPWQSGIQWNEDHGQTPVQIYFREERRRSEHISIWIMANNKKWQDKERNQYKHESSSTKSYISNNNEPAKHVLSCCTEIHEGGACSRTYDSIMVVFPHPLAPTIMVHGKKNSTACSSSLGEKDLTPRIASRLILAMLLTVKLVSFSRN